MRRHILCLALILGVTACASTEPRHTLQADLDALQDQRSDVPGFAMALIWDGEIEVAATGVADPDGTPMSPSTPVRIASITKTFVAASALRLWEDGRLDLDASIDGLLKPEIDALLRSDGYKTEDITARQLLMHASGMADHTGDGYVEQVFGDPRRVWTPFDQVATLVKDTDPLGGPGDQFTYSDTGYVLLGEVLKEVTGLPLHQAVRELLDLDHLDLQTLYWDEVEQPREAVPARAHQWIDEFDIFAIHGSMDGHGGGGLVASVEDISKFYHALFNDQLFGDSATLELMKAAPGHPSDSPYRIGLFSYEVAGYDAFHHGGFWGIYVTHVPSIDLTIAGVALDQSGYQDLRALMRRTIEGYSAE
jgi:D-alanyl-D-alanine carboxypeptidase